MFVITGGSSGIGKALALELAKRQKKVLIVGRNKKKLASIEANSPFISAVQADVSTPRGRQRVTNALKDTAEIKGLIHCAGIIVPITRVCEIKEKEWLQIVATNVGAPLFLTQALMDKLRAGRVLQMVSFLSYQSAKGLAAYCATKAALAMLTSCWQFDDTPAVMTSVNPGIVDTPIQDHILHAEYVDVSIQSLLQEMKQKKQLIPPETVAQFLIWLLLGIDKKLLTSKEWDIYDKSHHKHWLKPPYTIPKIMF